MKKVEIDFPSGTEVYTTHAIQIPGGQSLPLLVSVAKVTRAINLDAGFENSTVEITLSDHSGHFKSKLETADRYVLGRTVRVYRENNLIFTGKCTNIPRSEKHHVIIKADIFSLMGPVNTPLEKSDFPLCPEENVGKYPNIIYGHANARTAMFTAYRIDDKKYIAAWNTLSDLTSAQDTNGNNILPYLTLSYDTNGSTYIIYNSGDPEISFSAEGPTDQGTISDNPADMLSLLLSGFTTLTLENQTETAAIFESRGYLGNCLFITGNPKLQDVLRDFGMSFNSSAFISEAGNVKITTLRYSELNTASIEKTEVKGFQYQYNTRLLKKRWHRKFQYCPKDSNYTYSPAVTTLNDWTSDVGEFPQKYIVTDSTSWDAATRDKMQRENPLLIYSFSIPFSTASTLDLGDMVAVTTRKNIYPTERSAQIVRIAHPQKRTGFVLIEAFDFSSLKENTFILQEPGHPDVARLYEYGDPRNPILWFVD